MTTPFCYPLTSVKSINVFDTAIYKLRLLVQNFTESYLFIANGGKQFHRSKF